MHDGRQISLLLAFLLAQDSNCVDVGCHEGAFLREVLRLAPHGEHKAFEPLPHLASNLRAEFPSVEVHEVALSSEAGTASFVHVVDLPGYSGLRKRTYPGEQSLEEVAVTTARLDDVLPQGYTPDLIKVDVEGAEELVLRGAIETLRRARPVVIFEHGAGAADHYGTTPEVIHELFEQVGLRIFDLDGQGPYSREGFAEEFHRNERWNFVAHR